MVFIWSESGNIYEESMACVTEQLYFWIVYINPVKHKRFEKLGEKAQSEELSGIKTIRLYLVLETL